MMTVGREPFADRAADAAAAAGDQRVCAMLAPSMASATRSEGDPSSTWRGPSSRRRSPARATVERRHRPARWPSPACRVATMVRSPARSSRRATANSTRRALVSMPKPLPVAGGHCAARRARPSPARRIRWRRRRRAGRARAAGCPARDDWCCGRQFAAGPRTAPRRAGTCCPDAGCARRSRRDRASTAHLNRQSGGLQVIQNHRAIASLRQTLEQRQAARGRNRGAQRLEASMVESRRRRVAQRQPQSCQRRRAPGCAAAARRQTHRVSVASRTAAADSRHRRRATVPQLRRRRAAPAPRAGRRQSWRRRRTARSRLPCSRRRCSSNPPAALCTEL